jgi:acyl dehydratase
VIAPTSIDALSEHLGKDLGATDWRLVTQEDVNRFAEATSDHLWIHTDSDRARYSGLSGTIVHGFYTLSLAPKLLGELISFEHFGSATTYGLDRVRFTSLLPVGDRVRMHARLDAVEPRSGGADLTATLTFERADGYKPVCVAEFLFRLHA